MRMRTVIEPQHNFGETDIAAIIIDPKSRDDIPPLLRGLQQIYADISLRKRVFAIWSRSCLTVQTEGSK